MQNQPNSEPWFAVRCVIRFDSPENRGQLDLYEERVTLWRAASFEEAVQRAETEAQEYAELVDGEHLGLAQAFHLAAGDPVRDGDEVFSLIRESELPPREYVDRFFDTGHERQES